VVCKKIASGVFYVGVQDPKRKVFDELIPLPDGTSYNAYVVEGSDTTALIDTAYPPLWDEFKENLKGFEIDYIIANHAEGDHSGVIPTVLELFPNATVVTNKKCKELLQDWLGIEDAKFRVIEDGEELSLGGKTLRFIFAPWVHWPETMFTHLKDDNILFTCDFLGSHIAGDELFAKDREKVYKDAKRYYAEIMMPFRQGIKKHIETVRSIKPRIVATSHGPIYDDPEFILSAYEDWVSDTPNNEVVIAYVSMYGNTKSMVEFLKQELEEVGVMTKAHDLGTGDIGELAMDLVDAATVIIATPTVLAGAHPLAAYAAILTNALRPKAKYATVIGSFGWGGIAASQIQSLLSNLKLEFLKPVVIKGHPGEDDFTALRELAHAINKKHEGLK
jgi:flavorubredoxin